MNREIKFRFWIPILKRFEKSETLKDALNRAFYDGHDSSKLSKTGHQYTYGEYHLSTGLLDKNKNEIFEFDILKDPYGQLGVVKYLNGAFKIENIKNKSKLGFGSYSKQCEVIGNIYEHTNLIN